jgi:hypothetical protein
MTGARAFPVSGHFRRLSPPGAGRGPLTSPRFHAVFRPSPSHKGINAFFSVDIFLIFVFFFPFYFFLCVFHLPKFLRLVEPEQIPRNYSRFEPASGAGRVFKKKFFQPDEKNAPKYLNFFLKRLILFLDEQSDRFPGENDFFSPEKRRLNLKRGRKVRH